MSGGLPRKATGAGMNKANLPDGWKVETLEKIGRVSMCKRVFKKQTSITGDIPFYKIGTFGKEPDAFISNELYEKYCKKFSFPKKGDVLISASGTIGRRVVYDGTPAYFQDSNIVWLDNNESKVLNRFLYYFYEIVRWRTAEGATISRLYNNILKEVTIAVPPLPEQKAIANILQTWDTAIEKTEALIAAKEKQFGWLCQRYFTPNSAITSSWEHHIIGNFVNQRKEKAAPSEDAPLCSLTIKDGVTTKTERYNREFLVKDKGNKTYKVVHPKDIVFNPANLRWGAIARSEMPHKVVLSPIYEVFRILENKIDSDFLTFALTCKRQIGVFATKTEGTLIERMAVKADVFELCKIIVPPSRTQQKHIAEILNTAKKEINVIGELVNQYRTQKRGLMQKLLSGKWRAQL